MSTLHSVIHSILALTAWRMEPPAMYGRFHCAAVLIAVVLAVCGAVRAKGLRYSSRIRLLASCGWLLAVLEVYKQLFIYHIVGNCAAYDWWYFPFQLCSVPMYLCILLPLIAGGSHHSEYGSAVSAASYVHNSRTVAAAESAILTFLAGFTFTGAAAALAVPEDFMRSYVTLTLHGFIWHGLLLFISLTVVLSGIADFTVRGFARSVILFLGMCIIAVCINVLVEPAMAAAYAKSLVANPYAAMFYLNPYHLSPQPFVDIVQKSAGIPAGLALYVLVIIAVSGAADFVFSKMSAKDA